MLFAGSLLLSLVLYEILLHKNRELELIRSRIPGHYQTPSLNIRMKPSSQRADLPSSTVHPTVLFIHGLSASKSAMIHLGTQFAKWGMNSYLIDLPGHGESTQEFSWTNSQSAVQEVLTYLTNISSHHAAADEYSADAPILLVGHSMGAALAIQAGMQEPGIAGVIAVSPAATQVDRAAPKRLLILLGEFDLPFVRRAATFLFQQATGMPAAELENLQTRSGPDSSKRIILLPWTEHSLGIFTPRALFEMASWLKLRYPEIDFDAQSSLIELLLKLSLCSLLLYSLVPGFDLLHRAMCLLAAKRSGFVQYEAIPLEQDLAVAAAQGPGWLKRVPPLWLYGLVGMLSVALLLAFNPWDRLRLLGGGYLCGFLCLSGVAALCCRRPGRATLSCSWVDLTAVLLSVALFIYAAGPMFSRIFVHLTVSPTRFWRLPILAASIYPFFLFDEWVSRCWITSSNRTRLIHFHFSTRLLLALVLILGFFVLRNRQFLIVLILPALLTLSSLCWFQAWGVYNKTRSVAASAAFSAVLTAWFLGIFFVQL